MQSDWILLSTVHVVMPPYFVRKGKVVLKQQRVTQYVHKWAFTDMGLICREISLERERNLTTLHAIE